MCLAAAGLLLAAGESSAAELTADAAFAAAQAAARYMISVETADGRFLYEFDFLAGRFTGSDNIVRQAGGAYGLSQYVFLGGEEAAREPARRALDYALKHPATIGDGVLVSADGTAGGARVGATALALLAAVYQLRMAPDAGLREAASAWVRGLAATQRADGTFPSPPDAGAADSYASGEAWYGLARWVDLQPDDALAGRLVTAADKGLMAHFLEHPDQQFFHWGLMASAQRYATTGDARFLDFIEDMGVKYLNTLAPAPSPGANSCAAAEGLGAGLVALGKGGRTGELVAALRQRMETDLQSSLALQVRPGQTRITFGAQNFYEDPKLANFAGGFRNGAQSLAMRIDSTQHCLSALMTYRQLAAR